MESKNRSTQYQICIRGILDERWLRWYEGLEITASADNQTIIRGEFDQSAMRGLLTRILDLGLELVSVHQKSSDDE